VIDFVTSDALDLHAVLAKLSELANRSNLVYEIEVIHLPTSRNPELAIYTDPLGSIPDPAVGECQSFVLEATSKFGERNIRFEITYASD